MCWSSLKLKNTQKEERYDLTYTPTGGSRYDIDGMSDCTHQGAKAIFVGMAAFYT